VYAFTQACPPALLAGHGAVVSFVSIAGLVGAAGPAACSSTKAAIITLTGSLVLEHGHRVRVNAACPGDIPTRMMAGVLASPALRDAMAERIPARRFGRPEDVVNEILVLRHLAVLQRRQPRRPKLDWAEGALIATLLSVMPKGATPRTAAAGHPGNDPALAP
jgi:NAD(P)-dependent dehydrogenase (short-subunit alcohol dehydrogenase family)